MLNAVKSAEVPQFFRFLLVGGVGFIVDAGIVLSLMARGIDPIFARLASMALAALATWRLNRSMTFPSSGTSQSSEGLRYLAIVLCAAGVNYAVFMGLVTFLPVISPVLSVAIATGTSMWVSYFGFAFIAFRNNLDKKKG